MSEATTSQNHREGASAREAGSRIDRLVLVAGASCTGKSTFIRSLATPAAQELPEPLRALDLPRYTPIKAIDGPSGQTGERLLLHYDLFRPITFHGSESFEDDPALDVIGRADRVVVLTLFEETELLRRRSVRRRRALWRKLANRSLLRHPVRSLSETAGAWRWRQRMRPWFACPDRMAALHERWFDFMSERPIEAHWRFVPSRGMECRPVDVGSSRRDP